MYTRAIHNARSRMKITQIAWLVMVILSIAGCLPPDRTSTPVVTDTIVVTPTPPHAQMVQYNPVTATNVIRDRNVRTIVWSPDGKAILYALEFVDPDTGCCRREWRRLDLATMQVERVQSPPGRVGESIKIDWLGESIPSIQLSPNGTHVIYQRIPQGYVTPDPPRPMPIEPYELWSSKLDGSEATRLWAWELGCTSNITPQWFLDGTRLIINCTLFEGGRFERIVVNIDGSEAQTFAEWVGMPEEDGSLYYLLPFETALSPDNHKVVFNKGNSELWIGFPETKAPPQKLTDLGLYPQWSTRGDLTYYFSIDRPIPDAIPDLVAYNLVDKTRKILLGRRDFEKVGEVLGENPGIGTAGVWQVSPAEDALLVGVDSGIWLVRWR